MSIETLKNIRYDIYKSYNEFKFYNRLTPYQKNKLANQLKQIEIAELIISKFGEQCIEKSLIYFEYAMDRPDKIEKQTYKKMYSIEKSKQDSFFKEREKLVKKATKNIHKWKQIMVLVSLGYESQTRHINKNAIFKK